MDINSVWRSYRIRNEEPKVKDMRLAEKARTDIEKEKRRMHEETV